jgi:protein-tyrosine kinase
MGIIEEATKRLEQLERAGVAVPWSAARVARGGDHLRSAVFADRPAVSIAAPEPDPADAKVSRVAASPVVIPLVEPAKASPQRGPPSVRIDVDLDKLRSDGYLVPDRVRSQVAAEFRQLKRTLLKNARTDAGTQGQRGALIMVTSAVPGEGKTFCSINLAMSMAMEVDTAVLLVDADVVRPSVLARLGIDAHPPGLLDVLTRDDLKLCDALVATNVPKLTIMSEGSKNDRSTELLASNAMDRLLATLTTDYADHIVIFDAPPLLLTTESAVLAAKVGQVVVVVEASKTPSHLVREAFEELRACPQVLAVLNKCDEPVDERRYGYYYG